VRDRNGVRVALLARNGHTRSLGPPITGGSNAFTLGTIGDGAVAGIKTSESMSPVGRLTGPSRRALHIADRSWNRFDRLSWKARGRRRLDGCRKCGGRYPQLCMLGGKGCAAVRHPICAGS
jgi:hypothetical protein